jgi:antitoxin ParD1/3/4
LNDETGKIKFTVFKNGACFMSITLTTEMEKLVNERLMNGAFSSAEEIILAGLRLLKSQEEKLEALRREIEVGVEDGRNGRFTVYSTDEEIERLAEQL